MAAPANSRLFDDANKAQTYLKARGFLPDGARSGGIRSPVREVLTAGAVLLRTYHDRARLFGEWWFTPYEIDQVIAHFGRGVPAFGEGRAIGKGILQATLAVRHEWGNKSPEHLGLVAMVRLAEPLVAFTGEGDVAPDSGQASTLKPVEIFDRAGRRRGVRQIFLPEAWTYQQAFVVLERDLATDSELIRLSRAARAGPLPFET